MILRKHIIFGFMVLVFTACSTNPIENNGEGEKGDADYGVDTLLIATDYNSFYTDTILSKREREEYIDQVLNDIKTLEEKFPINVPMYVPWGMADTFGVGPIKCAELNIPEWTSLTDENGIAISLDPSVKEEAVWDEGTIFEKVLYNWKSIKSRVYYNNKPYTGYVMDCLDEMVYSIAHCDNGYIENEYLRYNYRSHILDLHKIEFDGFLVSISRDEDGTLDDFHFLNESGVGYYVNYLLGKRSYLSIYWGLQKRKHIAYKKYIKGAGIKVGFVFNDEQIHCIGKCEEEND